MNTPQPTRPDPIIREKESWAIVVYPIAMALACGVIAFVLALRL